MDSRVLFCNVAYMQYYDFDTIKETPKHGGKYVSETGDALEKYNFQKCNDEKVRGFVETKYRDTYKTARIPNQIRIENIDDAYKKTEYIDNVTVFFCAHSETHKKCVLVGWYRNAVVYRNRKTYNGRQYNIECDYKDAFLIPERNRDFIIPRATRDGYGFGQANIWYAKEDISQDFVNKIKVYANNTPYTCKLEDDVMPQIIPQEYSESGIGKKILVNKYERNSTARRRCLEIHGTKCIICGFDAGEVYGDDYKDKIEVHHIIPIHKLKNDYKIDPCEDLVPVCPNCHMILHTKARNNEYPTIESLKSALGRKH